MNHENFRILISQYLDNEVTAEEKEAVENHLLDCVECQKYYAQVKKLSRALASLPNDALSPDLEIKIQSRLKKAQEGKKMEGQKLFKVGVPAGSLVVVLLIVGLTYNVYNRGLQGRLKSASDDIGEQFYAGNIRPIDTRDGYAPRLEKGKKEEAVLDQLAQSSPEQYEPYYLSETRGNAPVETVAFKMATVDEKRQHEIVRTITDESSVSSHMPLAAPNFTQAAGEFQEASLRHEIASAPAPIMVGLSGRRDADYTGNDRGYYYYQPPAYQTNTEQYDAIRENPFLSVINNPLSTFSIDVDTASYSNLRRFLNNGQRVPEDAVRIEEMVNYFSYDYPEPAMGQPFSVTTEVAACPWNPAHKLAMIGLQGKRIAEWAVPASNLVFLIDVSGSMNQPNKLPLLKNAFKKLTSQLSDKDRISIVVYAGAAGVVLESTPGSQKWLIEDAINRLQAGGSTAGGAGIQLAYQMARNHLIKNGNNRVILATDGDFNVGVSGDDELVRLIEENRNQNIFLTILGFGDGNYKDSKMEKIADHGNGNYFYIDSDREAEKVLVRELGSTLFTIAKDVKLQVEFNPATVKEYRLIGYENRIMAKEDFNDDTKDAGEIGAGHTVTAFYEIVPAGSFESHGKVDPLIYQKNQPKSNGSSDVMTVKLRYKDPKGITSKLIKKTVTQRDVSYAPRSENFQFGASVVEFGLVLRNSEHKGQASLAHAFDQARASSNYDPYGYRAEFVGLMQNAMSLYPQALEYLHTYPGEDNYPRPQQDYSNPVKQQK